MQYRRICSMQGWVTVPCKAHYPSKDLNHVAVTASYIFSERKDIFLFSPMQLSATFPRIKCNPCESSLWQKEIRNRIYPGNLFFIFYSLHFVGSNRQMAFECEARNGRRNLSEWRQIHRDLRRRTKDRFKRITKLKAHSHQQHFPLRTAVNRCSSAEIVTFPSLC